MRSAYPSARWLRRWKLAHRASNGHDGPVTVAANRPLAVTLYLAGATPRAAGIATANSYRLHAALDVANELLDS